MSASPVGSVSRLQRARVSLACAAVVLTPSFLCASPRHAAAPHAHTVAAARAVPASRAAVARSAGRSRVVAPILKSTRVSSASRTVQASRASTHVAPRGAAKLERAADRHSHVVLAATHSAQLASHPLQPARPRPALLSAAQKTAPAPTPHDAVESAAEERVRAWYQARAAAAPRTQDAPPAVSQVAAHITPAAPAHAAPVESSTEDDAAAIREESRIPSTAPTQRDPAPFAHGDLLVAELSASASAKPHVVGPAPLAGAVPPMLRGSSPAVKSVTVASSKPKLDPEAADALAREAFNNSDAVDTPRSATALVGSTANSKLAERPALAVLEEAPALRDSPFATDRFIAPMRGSHAILVHQNQMAVADGLLRIASDGQMADMQRHRLLVSLPDNESMQPDGRLPLNRRYARPWTVSFLNNLAHAHYARFHTPLVITSAVRTVAFQKHLVLVNGNAAPPTGDIASPHLYGQAIDLAKHGMSVAEIAWMRAWLTPIEGDGKIDVEEEFLQSCFHISVYRRYAPEPVQRERPAVEEAPSRRMLQAKATPAKRRRVSTALLAAGLRYR